MKNKLSDKDTTVCEHSQSSAPSHTENEWLREQYRAVQKQRDLLLEACKNVMWCIDKGGRLMLPANGSTLQAMRVAINAATQTAE